MSWIKDKKSNYLLRCRELRGNSTYAEQLLWESLRDRRLCNLKTS